MRYCRFIVLLISVISCVPGARAQSSDQTGNAELARSLNVSFSPGSSSVLFLERDGKRYVIDVATKSIREASQTESAAPAGGAALFQANCAGCHGPAGKGIPSVGTPDFTNSSMHSTLNKAHIEDTLRRGKNGRMPSFAGRLSDDQIGEIATWVNGLSAAPAPPGTLTTSAAPREGVYQPGDDVLFSLPTGRATDRHGVYFNFSHRFPFDSAFQGLRSGSELFGLDDFALPSLGVRYGFTDKFFGGIMRSPSFIGRPIQLMLGYTLLEERRGDPFNLTVRFSMEGQNNFRKNYTENIEAIFSRSITRHAQFYVVPTASFNDRRLVQGSLVSSGIPDIPGVNAFSLGVGLAIDIRPTVALVAEMTPTLVGGAELGIHRPSMSYGIQKKIFRHAFTVGVSNSPGVTVSQRAGTDASYLGKPSGDTFQNMFVGFDLTRQIE
jgi:mono/diheme cytochrome c family protein